MTDGLLAALGAYSLQIACIVVAGSVLPLFVRTTPPVQHAWWRCLLLATLALPWLLHGARPAVPSQVTAVSTFTAASVPVEPNGPTTGFGNLAAAWSDSVGIVLLGGVLLHLAWIAAGLFRLRRLRRAGRDAELAPDEEWLQELLQTRASVRYVESLDNPVTFGFRRPVVLLPVSLRDRPAAIQRAVLCHELVHVQRRDWPWLIAEEVLRAAFWFHPLVRWLLVRIQLTREEVVDEIAVAACGSDRRTYIEALMAFADDTRLTPAAAFSRRRHLYHRILRLSKETVMSFRRVAILGSLTLALVAGASWLGAGAFPTAVLSASQLGLDAGPLERAAHPVTGANPVPALRLSTAPAYPSEGKAANVEALITLKVTVDQFGRVAEMRRADFAVRRPFMLSVAADPMTSAEAVMGASGFTAGRGTVAVSRALDSQSVQTVQPALEAMFQSAGSAVAHWQYEAPKNAPIAFLVRFLFQPEEPEARTVAQGRQFPAGFIGMPPTAMISMQRTPNGPSEVAYPPQAGAAVGGSAGAQTTWTAGTRVEQGVRLQSTETAGAVIGSGGALRVGGGIAPPVRLKHVSPRYPETAQAARVQGIVIIEATVGADGRVAAVRILRSIPELDEAALEAVRQWEYQPTLLNGVPMPVIMTTTVNFSLAN